MSFFVDALREALSQVKDLSRQIPELNAIRIQLEAERDSLRNEVSDLQDALKDAQTRLEAANNTLNQLKADLERRLREKDEELDGIRYLLIRLLNVPKFILAVGFRKIHIHLL